MSAPNFANGEDPQVLLQQLLTAIDTSPIRDSLPRFCASMRSTFQNTPVWLGDARLAGLWISFFTDPDFFLNWLATEKVKGESFIQGFLDYSDAVGKA